jgi:Spy/CpxP family protein refolding chaperone
VQEALGLTDGQLSQLRQMRREQAQASRPMAEQMRGKSQALRDAMTAPNPDPAQVGQMMVELKGLREQMRAARSGLNEKALAVLTPDQKTKLTTLSEAGKAAPAVRQARTLGLLAPPEGGARSGMQGMGRGARARRAPAPGVQ